jgi:small-conductance mechanosensitive channel
VNPAGQATDAWLRLNATLDAAIGLLPSFALAVVVLLISLEVARRTKRIIVRLVERRGRRQNVGLVIGRLAQWGVAFLGTLVALTMVVPSLRAGDLIQMLGIGSVAFGFAFRDVLQNFVAGLILLLTEPFRIGDRVSFGGSEGRVVEIETRATTMITDEGDRVLIPNGKLFTESLVVKGTSAKFAARHDVA